MPTSGSGTGTPVSSSGIPPTTIPDAWPNCAVSLSRYQQIIGVDEAAFWGVTYEDQSRFECTDMWSEWQRQMVADALAQSQQMIEDIVNYPLCPTWITGFYDADEDPRYVDQQAATGNPIITRWAKIIQAGVMAESTIDDDATVDYSVEPAVIGPFTTTITDTSEVRIRFPDSDRIITPSRMTYTGGVLTIYVPRCRLVSPDLLDETGDPNVGLEKTDLDNFTTVVDVKRVYNDPSTHGYLVREHACDALCTAEGCATQTDAACIVIRDPIMGIVDIHPGSYSGGWSEISTSYCYDRVRLNYQAGLRTISRQVESAIVRLAHVLMAEEPCGCAITQRLWARDRKVVENYFGVQGTPFGNMEGAHFAYNWAMQNMVVRGGVA